MIFPWLISRQQIAAALSTMSCRIYATSLHKLRQIKIRQEIQHLKKTQKKNCINV